MTETNHNCIGAPDEYTVNNAIIGNILATRETAKSAEFYKNQLFPIFTEEQFNEHDKERAKVFSKESFAKIRKEYRPDLAD